MTKANPLVLDDSEVKLRLQAERTSHKTPVHVDWVLLGITCTVRVRVLCLARYARVSTTDQETTLQIDALKKANIDAIY